MSNGLYNYKAKIVEIYDGDTFTAEVDLGFRIKMKIKLRLDGINTPELRGKDPREKELAKEVRDFLRENYLNSEIILETKKKGKYGRYLSTVRIPNVIDPPSLNDLLIKLGYAREYHGEKRKGWFED